MKLVQVYEFIKQFCGGAENIPFLRTNYNNEIGRERNKYLESNDAQTLLEYLNNKQIDELTGRISNFCWVDGHSIMDYKCFGDVVSFDTTF
jgi:prepilin-type processing-associated H-X9-DG protein